MFYITQNGKKRVLKWDVKIFCFRFFFWKQLFYESEKTKRFENLKTKKKKKELKN